MAEATVEFAVDGIDTEEEAQEIETELEEHDGILNPVFDHEEGTAEIHYHVDLISDEGVKRQVRELGYDVE